MASVIERVEAFEPHIAATWLYAPERALTEARASEARWMRGRADRPARRRAGDRQGQHRHPRRPDAGRHRGERHDAGRGRRAARRAPQGGGRDPVRQDDDARLRHAVVGPVEPSSARPQSLEARPQPRRIVGGRRRGGGGALRAAACRHRHRRLGPPAGGLVRNCRPEAERRPRADRSALYRPRRRPA